MTIHTTQESLKGRRTGISLAVTQYSLLVDTVHNKYYISFRNHSVKQGLTCLILDLLLIVISKTPIPKTRSQGSIMLVSSERERDAENENAVSQMVRQMERAELSWQRRQKLRNYFASCRVVKNDYEYKI